MTDDNGPRRGPDLSDQDAVLRFMAEQLEAAGENLSRAVSAAAVGTAAQATKPIVRGIQASTSGLAELLRDSIGALFEGLPGDEDEGDVIEAEVVDR